MTDIISQFTEFMRSKDCGPENAADIIADDKWRNFRLAGDPVSKKAGSYIFGLKDGFGFGACRNHREGVTHNWHSKADRTYTAEEKAAWKARVEADKAARTAEIEAGYERAALEAEAVWKAAKAADAGHAYLFKKGISPARLRQDGADLLVPMKDSDNKLWGYQRITPDGDKYFLAGSRVVGCYDSLPGSGTDVLVIAEGRATAAAIAESTGLSVVAAFTAGNLRPVAHALRKKYPKARLLVAADNDQWAFKGGKKPDGLDSKAVQGDDPRWKEWRDAGLLYNTGREKSAQAAAACGGFSIWPDIPENDKDKRNDFNDVFLTDGPDAVRTRILAVAQAGPDAASGEVPTPCESDAQLPAGELIIPEYALERLPDYVYEAAFSEIPIEYATHYDPAPKANRDAVRTSPIWSPDKISGAMIWKKVGKFVGDPDARLENNSTNNLMVYLRHHEGMNGVFRLDIFSGKIMMHRAPPWESQASFKVRAIDDVDLTMFMGWLERVTRMMPNMTVVRNAVYAVAKECYIDPPLEYLERIVWDREPRLHRLFTAYFSATEQPAELLEALAVMWLVGGVARQFRPGCKLDNIVVFEGWGGAKKSTALETLATINGEKYFSDGMDFDDLKNKDSIAISRGKLIIEFQEMGGLGTVGIDRIIKWLSIKTDECRVPYATQPQRFDRRFLLAGTTNESIYLPAHGGIRRFWSVKCGDEIDIAGLARDCEQLWAEAVTLYKAGTKWWIDRNDPVRRLVENEQRIRISERALAQPVLDWLDRENPRNITASAIISGLGIGNSQRTKDMLKEVNLILKENDWKPVNTMIGGKKGRGWSNPAYVQDLAPVGDRYEVVENEEEVAW